MDGIPAQVVEVLGRTGMRGEATSVKVRVCLLYTSDAADE